MYGFAAIKKENGNALDWGQGCVRGLQMVEKDVKRTNNKIQQLQKKKKKTEHITKVNKSKRHWNKDDSTAEKLKIFTWFRQRHWNRIVFPRLCWGTVKDQMYSFYENEHSDFLGVKNMTYYSMRNTRNSNHMVISSSTPLTWWAPGHEDAADAAGSVQTLQTQWAYSWCIQWKTLSPQQKSVPTMNNTKRLLK